MLFFKLSLRFWLNDFKPAGDLCVAVDATGNFKGGLGCMPPSF